MAETLSNVEYFVKWIFNFLKTPVILGQYSLWNVFQGMFGVFVFRVIIMDGVLNWKTEKGSKYNRIEKNQKLYANRPKRRK